MENKTLKQIEIEILELKQKIQSVETDFVEVREKEKETPQIDFGLFMEWADNYFIKKDNVYSMANDLENAIDLDDCCRVDLSLCGNEIEIEKEWRDTEDIVKEVLELAKQDFRNWMIEEFNNHTGKEFENNL